MGGPRLCGGRCRNLTVTVEGVPKSIQELSVAREEDVMQEKGKRRNDTSGMEVAREVEEGNHNEGGAVTVCAAESG